jgi:hypothetical protein
VIADELTASAAGIGDGRTSDSVVVVVRRSSHTVHRMAGLVAAA